MSLQAITKCFLVLGKCVPCVRPDVSKFKIKRLELDENLLMYFSKHEFLFAHDPGKKCKTGDIVLIEKVPQQLNRLITHNVKQIVYPMGDMTDPITGKKAVVGNYREQVEKLKDVYGESPDAFKYDDAPERGWQEGRKDFSHKPTYVKYHEDGKKQPYGV